MGFGQTGAKRRGGRIKVINWGGNASHKRGTLFLGRRGEGVLTMYCSIVKFYCKSYWVL